MGGQQSLSCSYTNFPVDCVTVTGERDKTKDGTYLAIFTNAALVSSIPGIAADQDAAIVGLDEIGGGGS
jgi:hypothetical protein